MRMDEELDALIERSISNIGKLLAKQRWSKATKADRAEQGRRMAAGRAKARRAKKKGKGSR